MVDVLFPRSYIDPTMLAEKRSRERWSQDPRNTLWSNDTTKFGYRMLQKMGWAEGKGLGTNEDGSKEHVKVRRKMDTLGLGGKKGRDDEWMSHQDEFNQILAGLNAHQASTEQVQVEDHRQPTALVQTAVESKRLVYHKFLRSKDMSSVSSQDLDCVLGRRRPSRQSSPKELEDNATQSEATGTSHGITTITRKQCMREYFLSKSGQKGDKGESESVNPLRLQDPRGHPVPHGSGGNDMDYTGSQLKLKRRKRHESTADPDIHRPPSSSRKRRRK